MIVTEKKFEKNIKEIFQKIYLFYKKTNDDQKNNFKTKILKSRIFIKMYFRMLLLVNIFSNSILLRLNKNLSIKKIHKLLS